MQAHDRQGDYNPDEGRRPPPLGSTLAATGRRPRYTYTLNEGELVAARLIAEYRTNKGSGVNNWTGKSQFEVDYDSVQAEIAVSQLANLCWTGLGRGEAAKPNMDVGNRWEVRSVTQPHYGLIYRAKDRLEDPCVCVYVGPDGYCEVLGWHFFAYVYAHGRKDGPPHSLYWTLPQKSLLDWEPDLRPE